MAKNQSRLTRSAAPARASQTPAPVAETEQDKKDARSFFKWMGGITLVLVFLMYYMFSKVV